MNVSLFQAASAAFSSLQAIWRLLHLLNRVFNMYLSGLQLHTLKLELKSTLRHRAIVSLHEPMSVFCALRGS